MRRTMQRYALVVALAAVTVFPLIGTSAPAAVAGPRITGAVYSLTNTTGGNSVAVFLRDAGGRLHPAGTVGTGGTGTGRASVVRARSPWPAAAAGCWR